MRCTRILLAAASLAATVDAHAYVPKGIRARASSPLEVTLAPAAGGGVAELVATIKNVGGEDLNLLKVGTILDDVLPIQKVSIVDEAGVEAQFQGIEASLRHDALKPEHFVLVKASGSVSTTIRAAPVHEFPHSGTYTFSAAGLLPVARPGSTTLVGPALEFQSNQVQLAVSAAAAAAVPRALQPADGAAAAGLEARTNLQPGCSAERTAATEAALADCAQLAAAAAAEAADASSARFVEYFGTNETAARAEVATRLERAAAECGTTDAGVSRFYCFDYYGICELEGPLNAYTLWSFDTVVACPLFFEALPALPPACHRQCRATTAVHEMTHCEGLYSPHTNDWAYGYNESVALPPDRALMNADNYSLFANAVYLDC
ncbi:Deuterolysin metalloprotease family-domain-containing protein [Durotheca rogersii]|uniref:Deuterolysin metalloprotease family-domain-containing protein n=1 Tax=Durotheca rogersii TaxID=419775 RepID=UPI00221F1DD9|nr:Deuterolysin metalloprotease family-domain-containing protein [Durotheca rogersii]KAI5862492.1 Deuterolysin metalloprotease family-domain-containing protein [Durotheca rogersii]